MHSCCEPWLQTGCRRYTQSQRYPNLQTEKDPLASIMGNAVRCHPHRKPNYCPQDGRNRLVILCRSGAERDLPDHVPACGIWVCQAAKAPQSHRLITPKLLLSPTVWDGPAGSKTAASVLLFLLKLGRAFGGGSGEICKIFISRAALTILTSVLSGRTVLWGLC